MPDASSRETEKESRRILAEKLLRIKEAVDWLEASSGYPVNITIETFTRDLGRLSAKAVAPAAVLDGLRLAEEALRKNLMVTAREKVAKPVTVKTAYTPEILLAALKDINTAATAISSMDAKAPLCIAMTEENSTTPTLAVLDAQEMIQTLALAGRDLLARWQAMATS
jgi:hypothetical protein